MRRFFVLFLVGTVLSSSCDALSVFGGVQDSGARVREAKYKEQSPKAPKAARAVAVVWLLQTLTVFASNAKLFTGTKTNAEISEDYPTLMTPAGYAFSIWGA
jgi:hypothetical protein